MERPALQRLLADMRAGRIDIVVVYGEAPSDAVPGRPLPLYELGLIRRGPS